MSKRLKAKGGKTCRMQNTLNQIPVFLCCLWCGLAAGIIYDLFRLVRIRGNRFATAAADTLFGAIAIGITAGALLYWCASVADPSRKAAQDNDYEA